MRALWLAAALAGCSSPARPPALNDVGGGADAAATEAGQDSGADAPDGMIADNPIPWRYVGSFTSGSSGFVSMAVLNGSLHSLTASFDGLVRMRLADGAVDKTPWTGAPSGYDNDEGVTCLVGTKAFVLTGGGNGIFSDYNNMAWNVADLATASWLPGGSLSIVRHNAAGAAGAQSCFLAGGEASQHGQLGESTVFAFAAGTGALSGLAPLPFTTSRAAAAVLGTTLLVAGGECRATGCTPAAPGPLATALDLADTLDTADPAATWKTAVRLPRPLRSAAMVATDGRFFVLGGWEKSTDETGGQRNEVLSWAPGETGWRQDGFVPKPSNQVFAFADGKSLVAVLRTSVGLDVYAWSR